VASLLDRLLRRRRVVPAERQLAVTFRRALLAVLDGDYDEAESLITQAVQADSDDLEPYRALARLYRLRGEVGRAIRIHQNLLLRRDLQPDQRDTVLGELAKDFEQGGFQARAIASWQELLAHDPRNRDALEALTRLHAEGQDYAAALETATKLARVDRRKDAAGESQLWLQQALADHRAGRHDAARKAVKRALRRDGSNAGARILLGELEAERGRNKAALAAWRQVPEQGGSLAAEVYPKIEATFAAVGRARDHETFLRGLLEQRPDDAAARLALASTLASRGETDPAVLELRRVLDVHPHHLQARLAIGRILLAAGRDGDAVKEYRELIEWLAARGEDSPAVPPSAPRKRSASTPAEGVD